VAGKPDYGHPTLPDVKLWDRVRATT